MSPKAFHAVLTLVLGVAVGTIWLRKFWKGVRLVPTAVVVTPLLVAVLGLGHWVAYDFSVTHWAAGFSLIQAVFNTSVVFVLLARRRREQVATLGC